MTQVIDFVEAKAKILGRGTEQEPVTVSPDLSNALEEFSFSRLPKLERIQRVMAEAALAVANPQDFEAYLKAVSEYLAPQLPDDVFIKPPVKAANAGQA